jgi:hypothetical protein
VISRLVRCSWSVAAVTLILSLGGQAVQAQGKLEARYAGSLAGLPIGRGALLVDIHADQFTVSATGATAGLLRVFASGQGSSMARGTVSGGQLVPGSYASQIVADKRTDDVRMLLGGGTVKEFMADPPTSPNPDRVPLTEAHRRNVLDPMTASLIRVPGTGNTFVPEACLGKIPVFDGRMRYDIQLAFKRLDKVKSDRGYQGTVVVCSAYFSPIAGHIPDRAAIKYLVQLREMETWLAPVAGTRFMAPYRISIPTPIGLGVLQASHFISEPQPARPSAISVTTQ